MSYTVAEILKWCGGRLANESELGARIGQIRVSKASALGLAREGDIAFFFSKAYQSEILTSKPSVLVTGEPFVAPIQASGHPIWKQAAIIACKDPYLAMAEISAHLAKTLSTVAHLPEQVSSQKAETHPSAVVHPSAKLGNHVRVGAHCVIEADAKIADGVVLYPGSYVGPGCEIGEGTVLFPRVTLYEFTRLGKRVRIHSGAVLGADGFGYAPKKDSSGQVISHQKIYHLGRVVVGDDVEIGANTCIDRGTLDDTVIESGAKIDDHVMLGHNTKIGEGSILCGSSAFAGSSSTGKFAYVGGLSAIANQVHIGDRANVGGGTGLYKDVEPGSTVMGSPQRDFKEYWKVQVVLNRLLKERKK